MKTKKAKKLTGAKKATAVVKGDETEEIDVGDVSFNGIDVDLNESGRGKYFVFVLRTFRKIEINLSKY